MQEEILPSTVCCQDNNMDGSESVVSTSEHRDSTGGGVSGGENGATTAKTELEKERATLGRKETRIVYAMKVGMCIVLVVATAIVASGAHDYVQYDQRKNFHRSFRASATKLIDTFHQTLQRHLEAVDALSVCITSEAQATNATFPNVTLPDFEVRFANTRTLSGSFLAVYYPLVTDKTRKGWEAYATKNYKTQIHKAYQSEQILRTQQDMKHSNQSHHASRLLVEEETATASETATISSQIFRFGPNFTTAVAPPKSGPYLPLWQLSPIDPTMTSTILNFDGLAHPDVGQSLSATIRSGHAAIDRATNLDDVKHQHTFGDKTSLFSSLLALSQYRQDIETYSGDPTSAVSYPVFDSFDITKRKVAGVIGTVIYWRLFFMNVLPPHTTGIICVIENTLGQMFTYQIDANVTYLGIGDLHDPKYDHMMMSCEDSFFNYEESSIVSESYTSVGIDEGSSCHYKLRIYPSQATENVYVNHDPMWATLVVLAVFLFTSTMFLLYTVAVHRRQQVVMDRAVASSAIVSSLFPTQVRDQIYQETTTAPETPIKEGGLRSAFGKPQHQGTTAEASNQTRPIASIFEHTTIMFADMVGFTQWSSIRSPVQVFELLETLYQAFDTIAVRRKVFKVETIGDCYVAVAGLPDPQEDHAVIMAKFADECMAKMDELTKELVEVLGPDTADLAMRVGLHSGSVTGGVLRGQKSRFQLFGDTMNTASRMESNGLPRRIHVSQETANELIAKGKTHWVTPREDRIVAKGKGELQTYWVSIRSASHSNKDNTTSPKSE